MNERATKAARIAASPEKYKICDVCDSIVAARVATCPNCQGYRFEDDPKAVIAQAENLGAREQRSVVADDLF